MLSSSALCTAALLAFSVPAQAQVIIDNRTDTVIGTGGGTQASPWNISGDLFVGDFNSGRLDISAGGVVSNEDSALGGLSGSGTVTVDGTGSKWTNSAILNVGVNGTGTLSITNGGAVSDIAGHIASESGSNGTVTVDGAGSTWTNSVFLNVGDGGTGTLTIANGGAVVVNGSRIANIAISSGSTGTLNIGAAAGDTATGAGTLNAAELQFQDGSGTLNFNHTEDYYEFGADISGDGIINQLSGVTDLSGDSSGFSGTTFANGGTLLITGTLGGSGGIIGSSAGTTGVVSVLRGGASWTTTVFRVGDQGTGTLTIAGGGTVSSGDAWIGNAADAIGIATVTGTGSSLAASNGVDIGRFGTGTLNIMDGATVTAGNDSFIGARSGSNGTVNVSGDGSSFDMGSNDLLVGDEGTGVLSVTGGGEVSTVASYIGDDAGSSGEVTVTGSGSRFTNSDNLVVGYEGAGSLTIAEGGSVSNTYGWIGDATTASGTANVNGDGSTWTNSQDLVVGNSGTGTLNITDGAVVSDNAAYVGNNADGSGTVTVSGTGSSWDHSSAFSIGHNGEGILKIENGGSVGAEDGYVAYHAGSEGTVTLTGAGSIWNTDATIVGDHGTGRITIAAGGALVTTNGYLGAETGTGTATVTGSGSKWTSAVRLVVGDFSTGTMTIADGGVVRSDAGTVDLGKELGADGTLNIGAAAGETAVGAGTLDAEMVQFGQGAGTINFNHTETDYEFAVDLSRPLGSGTINHIAGVTRLTGDASAFDGTTNITGGTLYVNNALGGAVSVTGGTLSGSGTLGEIAIGSGGSIAPGNSIGTLNVANITIAAGSTYVVEVNSAGQSDVINATGTATINGGTVTVVPFPDYALDSAYTIVTAAGGVTGTFDAATFGSSLFVTPTLTYDANNASVTLSQTATFASVATTPNQIAAAGGADSLGSGNAIFATIGGLGTTGEARAAFDAISGEIHASAKTALLEDSRFPREATMDRLRVALGDVGAAGAPGEVHPAADFGLWGEGFGAWSRWNGDGNAAAVDRAIGGFLMGGDVPAWDFARFGVLGGYSQSNFIAANRASSGTVDTVTLGAYGGGEWGGLSVNGGVAHGWHSLDTLRTVGFTGFADSLSSSQTARTLQGWGEAALGIEAGSTRLEPFAGLAHVSLATDGFTETGGAAALSAASGVVDATFTTLGLRAETDLALGDMDATLRGMVSWRHAFGGAPTSQMAFASGGDVFTIAGVPLTQDTLAIDAGMDMNFTESATLGFAWGGQFGWGVLDHSAKASLNVRF